MQAPKTGEDALELRVRQLQGNLVELDGAVDPGRPPRVERPLEAVALQPRGRRHRLQDVLVAALVAAGKLLLLTKNTDPS